VSHVKDCPQVSLNDGGLHDDLMDWARAAKGGMSILREKDAEPTRQGGHPNVGFISEECHVLLIVILLVVAGAKGSRFPADIIYACDGELDVKVSPMDFELGFIPPMAILLYHKHV